MIDCFSGVAPPWVISTIPAIGAVARPPFSHPGPGTLRPPDRFLAGRSRILLYPSPGSGGGSFAPVVDLLASC
jgi:hypothetical protein